MDIKTLSAVIGHGSSATTLNVYAHVTDEMGRSAAAKIDQAIARVEPQLKPPVPKKPAPTEEGCEEKLDEWLIYLVIAGPG